MKLTREQKILMVLLGGGLMALGVDRFVLGEASQPAIAAADVSMASPAAAAGGTALPQVPAAAAEVTGPSIAERLQRARIVHASILSGSRDAFTPVPGWMTESPTVREDPPRLPLIEAFVAGHRLSGVMNDRIALIDGRAYRVGDTIGPAVLTDVRRDGVTLQIEGAPFHLSLAADP